MVGDTGARLNDEQAFGLIVRRYRKARGWTLETLA